MAVDVERALGLSLAPLTVEVERGRLRAFAAAIGETDPVYTDVASARAAGHRDLPAPPTFLFSLELEDPNPFGFLDELGIEMSTVLHGEQTFTYHALVHAGDRVAISRRIVDAQAKTPTMDFLVKRTEFLRDGVLVAEADALLISRRRVAA